MNLDILKSYFKLCSLGEDYVWDSIEFQDCITKQQ